MEPATDAVPALDLEPWLATVPVPDGDAEPDGYVVAVDGGDRIHFLDWTGTRPGGSRTPGVLLVHGLSQTAWIWAPVARRIRAIRAVVALDLRGHGLSDAPTEDDAYDLDALADDVVAVAEGSGLVADASDAVVVAGHGFGAIVAATAAARLGRRCAGLVLVDGGWEAMEAATGLDVEEFLRGLDEPPEVMRSIDAFLADRRAFDPRSWDDDQDRAARATIVETHAGRVVPSTRPHAVEACVRAMFRYEPEGALTRVPAPIIALVAADDDSGSRARSLEAVSIARVAAGRPAIAAVRYAHDGHNLMRYRPREVSAAILAATSDRRDDVQRRHDG